MANSIAIDASGAIYVTGSTTSLNFPTLVPIQAANAGTTDMFITKLTFGATPAAATAGDARTAARRALRRMLLRRVDHHQHHHRRRHARRAAQFPMLGVGFRGNSLYAWDATANRIRRLNPATGATVNTIDIGMESPPPPAISNFAATAPASSVR